jgi:hypothetical protein
MHELDKRLCELERYFLKPQGTKITRVLHPDSGVEWSLSLGQMNSPIRITCTSSTLEGLVTQAEQQVESRKLPRLW